MLRNIPIIIWLCFFCQIGFGQIILNNPSFEDEPADATIPMGWFGCERGTTPDILPGPWGVNLEAEEGETYVGLITRSDGSFESIGQRVSTKFEEGNCYQFTLSVASCDTYSGFNSKIYFRVWGGSKKCKKSQLLYDSELIDNTEWEEHKIKFTAEDDMRYIIIEAYYPEDKAPVKGHILIDNISTILACSKV